MTNVAKLLQHKQPDVWSIRPGDTVYDAIKMMEEKSIGALAVKDRDLLIGILSERDYARKVILKGRSSKDTRVEEIMTRDVLTTEPQRSIEHCMAVMTENQIRHLPIVEGNKLIGMISLGDVVKEIISEQKGKIEHLEHYMNWEENY